MATADSLPSLKELEKLYVGGKEALSFGTLRKLQRDRRIGAQKLYRKLKRKLDLEKKEQARLDAMFHFEQLLWASGLQRIAGVDEVGIGPMAGPVVAAAVVFPPGTRIDGVDDSKRLDQPGRESLDVQIRKVASGIGVGVVEPDEVDRLNVYHAGIQAMRIAVDSLEDPPEHVLVDSRTIPGLSQPQNSFIGGDGISFSIASASIVAKVFRDRLMVAMDRRFPGYGFAQHKGYCTATHQDAVRRLGTCPIHRSSFDFIREIQGEYHSVFYVLKQAIQSVATWNELQSWDEQFASRRGDLAQVENRKLSILARRRRKRLHPR
jgi:ribonuclease HII